MTIDDPQSLEISGLVIDTWKAKYPSLFSAFPPPEFMPFIGLVVVSWGMLEVMFDNFLTALIKSTNHQGQWKGLPFRRRRTLFADQMKTQFATNPAIVSYLQAILDDALVVYPKRNLIVHGHIAIGITNVTKDGVTKAVPQIECAGIARGVEIRDFFTKDDLEDLYYEISHLNGRLNAVSLAGRATAFSSPDILSLQAFLESSHPTYPNPTTLPPPRQASTQ